MSNKIVLEAFDRVLRLESHNLSRWPDLLWQQTYNELQWETLDEPSPIDLELARRTGDGSRPWLRRRTRLRQTRELVGVIRGHGGPITDCDVAPDGAWIASAGDDVRLWSTETGRELRRFQHENRVQACAVSSDGSFLVTASGDSLRIWDARSEAELRRLAASPGESMFSCAVSPDGSLAVGVGRAYADTGRSGVKVWDIATGATLQSFEVETSVCALAPDASYLVLSETSRRKEHLLIWDIATGRARQKLKGYKGRVFDVAIAPDGSYVVSGGEDGLIRTWDPVSGKELRSFGLARDPRYTLRDPDLVVNTCAVSPDGAWIAVGYESSDVKLWDPSSGSEIRTLRGHEDRVVAAAVSADGSFLTTGDMQGTLRIWSLADQLKMQEEEGHSSYVSDCAFAPSASFAVSASADATLKIWDPEISRVRRTLRGHQTEVWTCAVLPWSTIVVSGADEGTIGLWNGETGELVRVMRPPAPADDPLFVMRRVNACAVSPDTSFVVSAQGFSVSVWDPRQGRELVTFERHSSGGKAHIDQCAVSPDAAYVVSASAIKGGLWLWDPATGEEIRTLGQDGASSCAIAPDGSFIVADDDLWDPATGAHLLKLEGASHPCAVTPDAAYVITGGVTGTVCVWEARTGRQVAMIPLLGRITAVDVHPSKPVILCGDSTGNVNLIELMNVELGTLVTTPFRDGGIVRFFCPACQTLFKIERVTGKALVCPKCSRTLRLNSFVLERPHKQSVGQ